MKKQILIGQPETVGELRAMLWPFENDVQLGVVNAPRAKFFFEKINKHKIVVIDVQEIKQ